MGLSLPCVSSAFETAPCSREACGQPARPDGQSEHPFRQELLVVARLGLEPGSHWMWLVELQSVIFHVTEALVY